MLQNVHTKKTMATANALQLKAVWRHARRCGLCLAKFLLGMRTDCYFAASDQSYDVVTRFSDPNKRAMIWLSNNVFTLWPWLSTLDLECL